MVGNFILVITKGCVKFIVVVNIITAKRNRRCTVFAYKLLYDIFGNFFFQNIIIPVRNIGICRCKVHICKMKIAFTCQMLIGIVLVIRQSVGINRTVPLRHRSRRKAGKAAHIIGIVKILFASCPVEEFTHIFVFV